MSDQCPKGGDHIWKLTKDEGGWITHTCTKCKEQITRRREPSP